MTTYKLLIRPSVHFSWSEMDAMGAPLGARLALVLLCNLGLEPVRRDAGGNAMAVNSAWRSDAHQEALVAAGLTDTHDSDHEKGLAADVEVPALGLPSALMALIYANRAKYPFRQVILEYLNGEETHVHLALNLDNLLGGTKDEAFMYTTDRKNYPQWKPGLYIA